ncbi:peptidoglycan-associated lipoprotein [Thioclava sp. SK-1]|uniref:peptidoglycan-associated lipoprotein Pal n=1 Tax=Thioclava sp. SK-1 TaxID=1889770 RepID=UPI0008261796|nr:peptidoglycan-associated lipoprotein Pal [Thioclava sp. SK-1]OCX65889.1 peptidoglycan-associated lipoprotein [Thioclava sp. SK-1]
MKFAIKAAMVLSVLALAACNNPDKFGGAGGMGVNDPGGMYGDGTIDQAGISDPNSPAYFQQTIGDKILFLVDQSTISPDARTILMQQASWLVAHPGYTAIIEGHADEQGTREYNLALGARRANSVEQFLISQGVSANRLRTVSYGKERPLAVCSTESCYSKNRRAVTVIAQGAGA